MKAKTLFVALALLFVPILFPTASFAQEEASGSSATFHSILAAKQADTRAAILQAYLNKFNSPLAAHAQTFIAQADLYRLDWRFVAAISGKESTFAKEEPCVNPFGFGIYTGVTTCFTSYDEAIQTVSKSLRQQYMDTWNAQTVDEIGKIYAASDTWAGGVTYFMNDMQKFADSQPQSLPISL